MPAAFQCCDAGHGVRVIGCGDDDGVDVLLVHEPPEVAIRLCAGKLFSDRCQPFFIHVTKRDEVVTELVDFADAEAALSGDTDDADVQLVVRRQRTLRTQELRRGEPESGGGCGGASEKLAAGE
jgi:hypothetical protein